MSQIGPTADFNCAAIPPRKFSMLCWFSGRLSYNWKSTLDDLDAYKLIWSKSFKKLLNTVKSERLLWKMKGSQNEIPFEYSASKKMKKKHLQILKNAQKYSFFSLLLPWTAQKTTIGECMFQNLAYKPTLYKTRVQMKPNYRLFGNER